MESKRQIQKRKSGAREKNVILGITASIAAYKACDIINHLKKRGYGVTCVMTPEAEEFVTPLTLETLSGNKVFNRSCHERQDVQK